MTPTMWEEKPWRWLFTSVILQPLLLGGSQSPVPNQEEAGNVLYWHHGAGGFSLGIVQGCH